MIFNESIVCFAPTDYWTMNPSCTMHLMRSFARKNTVIYVNPISSDMLGLGGKKGIWSRVARKFRSIIKVVRRPENNLFVVSPMFIPVQGHHTIDLLNNMMISIQLYIMMLFLRMKNPILWIENIRASDFISMRKWKLVLYHVSDKFEECSYTRNREQLRRRELVVNYKSDIVVCVSKKLYNAKQTRDGVYYLPHGVDFTRFQNPKTTSFKFLRKDRKQVAGYFGTLTHNNDIELLEYCAKQNPDITFVFAGQVTTGDYSRLASMSNVVMPGRVAYEDIPGLCHCFDVCLLPWKMSKWIENCNPLKLFEYMASGKPIVSVPIPEVMLNSDVVSIANNMQEFSKAIRWELENDTEDRRNRRIGIASRHSWDDHIEILSSYISGHIKAVPIGKKQCSVVN